MPLLANMEGLHQNLATHLSQAAQQAVAQQQAASVQGNNHLVGQPHGSHSLGGQSLATAGLTGQIQSMSEQLADDHLGDQPELQKLLFNTYFLKKAHFLLLFEFYCDF